MNASLLVAVRFHDGRYHGAGDWPPSPARLFQALMAGSARGERLGDNDREALQWLERLPAPEIMAPRAHDTLGFINYVPNNALDAVGGDVRQIGKIRTTKTIKARLFDAHMPVLYAWRFDAIDEHMRLPGAICEMAESLFQLGRGVDMAWAVGEVLDECEVEARLESHGGVRNRPMTKHSRIFLDCPMIGSLVSLEKRFKAQSNRFVVKRENNSVRVSMAQVPKARFQSIGYGGLQEVLLFDIRLCSPEASIASLPFEKANNFVVGLRDAVVRRLCDALPNKVVQIERALICRNATEADKAGRVRIVPLPSIGHHHADRAIRRVLVEIPPNCAVDAADVAWAFSGLLVGAGEVDVSTGEVREESRLVPAKEDAMLVHYGVRADDVLRQWRTVTPIVLPGSAARRRIDPRHLREEANGGLERLREQGVAATAVVQALRHADILAPIDAIRLQREPFESRGARAEAFAPGTRFAKEWLWHVEIVFSEPVVGPLLIGDGRYVGLGLMAPVRQLEGVRCFSIRGELGNHVDPTVLARALRRAVMSRVQGEMGERARLPLFFSGHEIDGAPARNGSHAHLAFAADLERNRLLIIAPHVLEGRHATFVEKGYLQVLDASIADLRDLCVGASGRLKLARSAICEHEDPLFVPGRIWESVTEYQPTRHHRRVAPSEALISDVQSEIVRRGMLNPAQVEVIDLRTGPRGGLAGRLRLSFTRPVPGLMLIGRTRHFGGGLFLAVE